MTGLVPHEGGVERSVRYYDVDDTLVQVVGGGLPEVLRDGHSVRCPNVAKFAYGAMEIPFQEFQEREAEARRSQEERGAGHAPHPRRRLRGAASSATAPVSAPHDRCRVVAVGGSGEGAGPT